MTAAFTAGYELGKNEGYSEGYKAAIAAHEKALEAEGLVIVPREPTEAMVNKGSEGLDAYYHGSKDAEFHGSITACYKAMLAALEGK